MKAFLGGTCNNSTWRDEIIPMLRIGYFNPVVKDWTPDCMDEEIRQRKHCDFVMYTITPRMTGVYSIAEVVDDSNKRPNKTIFVILEKDGDQSFTDPQLKSLGMVSRMVSDNGGNVFLSLKDAATHMNRISTYVEGEE
jgi:hypothetical protein